MSRFRVLVVLAVLASAVFVAPAPATGQAATEDFQAVTPARILDTRMGLGAPTGPIGEAGEIELGVLDVGGVPARGVSAVVLNLTITAPTSATYLTVYPTGTARPLASSLNASPGQDFANLVIAKVGDDGSVTIYNNAGMSHVVADVTGWFAEDSSFVPLSPERLLDTREPAGGGAFASAESRRLVIGGEADIPTNAGSVVLNITAIEPQDATFVTVYPGGDDLPFASNLNAAPGDIVPNLAIAKIGIDASVDLYVNAGPTHLVVDVVGWFPDDPQFTGMTPIRAFDNRAFSPVPAGGVVELPLTGRFNIPPGGVGAVAVNITIASPTEATFATGWPTGQIRPTASTVNAGADATVPNLAILPVGAGGSISIYNNAGRAFFIVDVVGWFPGVTPPAQTPLDDIELAFEPVANFTGPVDLTSRAGTNLLYVAEQRGQVIGFNPDDAQQARPIVLNVQGSVSGGNEQGLLGIAFSPDGSNLFVNLTNRLGATEVWSYPMRTDGTADEAAGTRIFTTPQPSSNHNGGDLAFGLDGKLYVALGDGGGANDVHRNGQNPATPLGTILRLNTDGSTPTDNPFVGNPDRDERIWVWGLRNPWRISFDRETGDLWIGDVGQGAREEIDVVRSPGANLGWPILEGTLGGTPPADYVGPIAEYGRSRGRSITGGFVYRGQAIPALDGTYVYADFVTAELWGVREGSVVEEGDFDLPIPGGNASSFGEGPNGEIYALSLNGQVSRLIAG